MKGGQDGPSGRIILADNLPILQAMEGRSIQLVYVDPPFNTGRAQQRTRIRVERDEAGDRTGFQGARYRTTVLGRSSYDDRHPDYLAFLEPRLREAHRVLAPTGSLFFHMDYREAHYCKILLDEIFGRASREAGPPARLPRHGRSYILVDSNPEAARVMTERLVGYGRVTLADPGEHE